MNCRNCGATVTTGQPCDFCGALTPYQPKTGQPCACKRGVQRDNCPRCEGTGWRIDFRTLREKYPIAKRGTQ